MKYVMKAGVVSVALASATLLTPTASAAHYQAGGGPDRTAVQVTTQIKAGPLMVSSVKGPVGPVHHVHTSVYGRPQFGAMTVRERQIAIRLCEGAIQRRTDQAFPGPYGESGFRFRPQVKRIGPRAIEVAGRVDVSRARATTTLPASCVIRNGRIADVHFNAQLARQLLNWRQDKGPHTPYRRFW